MRQTVQFAAFYRIIVSEGTVTEERKQTCIDKRKESVTRVGNPESFCYHCDNKQ